MTRGDASKIDRIDLLSNFCGAAGALAVPLLTSLNHPARPPEAPPAQETVEIALEAGEEPVAPSQPEAPAEDAKETPQPLVEARVPIPTASEIVAAPRKTRTKHERKPPPKIVRQEEPQPRHRVQQQEKPVAKPHRAEPAQAKIGRGGLAARPTHGEGRRDAPDRGANAPRFGRPGGGSGAAYNACLHATPYPAAAIRQGRPSCTVTVSSGHLTGGCGSALLEATARAAVARCTALYGPSSGTIYLH